MLPFILKNKAKTVHIFSLTTTDLGQTTASSTHLPHDGNIQRTSAKQLLETLTLFFFLWRRKSSTVIGWKWVDSALTGAALDVREKPKNGCTTVKHVGQNPPELQLREENKESTSLKTKGCDEENDGRCET